MKQGGRIHGVSFTVSEVFPRQEWGGIIPVNSTTCILRWAYCDGDRYCSAVLWGSLGPIENEKKIGRGSATILETRVVGSLFHSMSWKQNHFRTVSQDTAVIVGLGKTTWLERGGAASTASRKNAGYTRLYIANCNGSTIYVTCPVQYVVLKNCDKHCQIIITSQPLMITCTDCANITLHSTADLVKLDNCADVCLFVAVRTPPIFCGDTRGIRLAPYNVLSHNREEGAEGYAGALRSASAGRAGSRSSVVDVEGKVGWSFGEYNVASITRYALVQQPRGLLCWQYV